MNSRPFQVDEVAKKLTLWHTRTFRPILTQDELEPIMARIGFVPLPVLAKTADSRGGHVAWREYDFRMRNVGGSNDSPRPRPRLPYPRIDGVHVMGYWAFFNALEFYLGAHLVCEIFHVRSMTLIEEDRIMFKTVFRSMKDCGMDDEGLFVYRDGTFDHNAKSICGNMVREGCNEESLKRNDKENINDLIHLVLPFDQLLSSVK